MSMRMTVPRKQTFDWAGFTTNDQWAKIFEKHLLLNKLLEYKFFPPATKFCYKFSFCFNFNIGIFVPFKYTFKKKHMLHIPVLLHSPPLKSWEWVGE